MAGTRFPQPLDGDSVIASRAHPPAPAYFFLPGPVGCYSAEAGTLAGTRNQMARDLVQQFARRLGSPVFVCLSRREVAEGLLARIDQPGLIDQAVSSLCGPASLLFDLASRDPVQYVRFAIDLFERGWGRIGRLVIEPGEDLRAYAPPPGSIPAVDWMTLASIRDSENWFFDYDEVSDQLAGITLPGELAGWFEQAGYTDVRNETNLLFSKDQLNAQEANALFRQRFRVCLFINSKVLYAHRQDESSATPDHWVVLRSQISFVPSVRLQVFSWGEGRRPVPRHGSLPLDSFLEHYYGYVACRY